MRLRALVRRAVGQAGTKVACGPISFDVQLGHFELGGLPMKLTGREWRVLEALVLRAELIVRVCDGDAEVDSNSVEVIITRLRYRIGAARLAAVAGGLELAPDGAPSVAANLAGEGFERPGPGWWWQVSAPGGVAGSAALRGAILAVPADPPRRPARGGVRPCPVDLVGPVAYG